VPLDLPAGKLRAFIVDDEPLARSNISALLKRDPEIEISGQCGSGTEAIAEIRRTRPDLVFLDVQMPECDGFDVLELLGPDLPAAIIFVTAYDQYAIRAFEAGALDYLLKPFDNARFERAISRARDKIRNQKGWAVRRDRIAMRSAGQVFFVKLNEVDWIEAADYYACFHVGTKSHLVRRSLAELDEELDPSMFCRVHRSAIVNLERVSGLTLNTEGEYEVVLENQTRLRLSRRYRKQLQERLGLPRTKQSRQADSPAEPG
jgi:two-component system, LytTR family, response regulator